MAVNSMKNFEIFTVVQSQSSGSGMVGSEDLDLFSSLPES
jgi:hypothetical protein